MSTKALTPREQSNAEDQAYQAWLDLQRTYDPPPQPEVKDLTHDNAKVVGALIAAVSLLPVLLAIIGLAAILISSDKTMWAFHASVANKESLGGAWALIVSISAVVMVEGGLLFIEFAKVRDMLRKGLKRRVWNWNDVKHSVAVRLGRAEPLDYTEMPDATLNLYSHFLFMVVLMSNTYGVLHAYTAGNRAANTAQFYFEFALYMFLGLAGAMSLRLIGGQLAHMTYELMAQRREELKRELEEQWRQEMQLRWQQDGPELIRQAMHSAFLRKNKLPLEASSPYLLTAGEEGELSALPLASSSVKSLTG